MAKRSNNIRSKKLQASKPYDVSNSFVKKVASRVTELLPQSIWPTKWFSSVNNDVEPRGNGRKNLNSPLISEKCDDTDVNPTPAKRARIPLNSSFSDSLYSASTAASGYETRRLRAPLPTNSEVDDSESVPGPSGIQPQYSIANVQSLNPKSRDSYSYNAKKLEVNGEDHSDSSESTSGCSSLPQGEHNTELRNTNQSQISEHQINGPESVTRTSFKRRYNDTANYSSMAIHSSRLFSGFGNYSPPNRAAPVPVGRRRNPSFNPDAFGPQNWSGEKTNIKDRIVNSPFYSGKTTYGGVSAYQSNLSRTENQYLRSGRRSIQVHPVNASEARGSASGMSNTARRILEALEMFSSPIQDAKKIPLDGSVNMKRRKVLANSDQVSMHSSRSSTLMSQDISAYMSYHHEDFAPPVRELVVPTVPDILAIRRRQKLHGSTVAAREVANETSMLPITDEKDSKHDSFPQSYPDIRSSRSGGKIKSKEQIDEEPSEEPDLPNIALPITSLPKFDFILPPACPPSYSSKQINSSVFKFSSPIAFSSASETLVSTNNFTFSSPLKATNKERFDSNGTRTCLDSVTESVIRPLETKMTGKGSSSIEKSSSNEEKVKKSGRVSSENKIELKSCEGVGLKNMIQDNCSNLQFSVGSNLSEKGTFGDLFKPALGSWECETCMVRNNSDTSKCVACETIRSSSSNSELVSAVKTFTESKSGFGDRFKPPNGSWSCDVCMIHNPSVESSCQACKTPRSTGVNAISGSENYKVDDGAIHKNGFGDKFKKSEGTWDCTICLVRNKQGGPLKCVACEAPKPGTESTDAASASVSSAKFSLGNIGASGFYFGIDKAGEIPKKDCSAEAKPTFTFGNTSSAEPGGFIFGRKSEEGSKVSAFTLVTSATSESSESDPSKKFALPQSPPKFTFGVKKVYEKTSSKELNKVQSETESGDDVAKALEIKISKEPEYKFGVGVATPSSSVIGTSAASKSSVVVNLKPEFTLVSTDEEKETVPINNFCFGSCTTVVKLENGKAFSSPSSSASNPSSFGMTPSTGWNNSPLFKIGSSKAPLFPLTTTSTSPTITKSDNKHDERLKAGPSTFKFGDASKADSTNNKFQEMPKTPSSNFKFQEPHKTTSSIFAVEDKAKTTSATTQLPPSTVTSNPFSSGVFTGLNNDKTTTSCEEPNSTAIILPTAADDSSLSTVIKTGNTGPIFMFGSGSSSPATAFNLIGQKQSTQTATATIDESVKPFASAGATSNVFGNLSSSKAPVFGSSSSPSPAAASLPAATSETRNGTNTVFASPSSNPIFGATVSTSVPSSSTTTTTTVSSTSSTFGSSIFGSAAGSFPGVGSSAPTFGSSTSTPLAAPPAFGVAPSSSVFGMNSTPSSAPFSFSGGTKSSSEEHHQPQPTNAPFVFGGGTAPSAQPFTFNAAPSKPAFSFGGSAVGQQPVVGTSSSAPAPGTAPALGGFSFGDASKGTTPFGTAQPATSISGGTSNPFGSSSTVPVANITPAASSFGAPLGESNAAASGTFGAPTFNFGSSQSNPTFSFNNNQPGSVPANISQAPAFNFGQTPQPSAASQPVTFNPNMPPSFNFTGGATPQFTATPGALNAAPAANPMQRRFKKAVRRSQQPR